MQHLKKNMPLNTEVKHMGFHFSLWFSQALTYWAFLYRDAASRTLQCVQPPYNIFSVL